MIFPNRMSNLLGHFRYRLLMDAWWWGQGQAILSLTIPTSCPLYQVVRCRFYPIWTPFTFCNRLYNYWRHVEFISSGNRRLVRVFHWKDISPSDENCIFLDVTFWFISWIVHMVPNILPFPDQNIAFLAGCLGFWHPIWDKSSPLDGLVITKRITYYFIIPREGEGSHSLLLLFGKLNFVVAYSNLCKTI